MTGPDALSLIENGSPGAGIPDAYTKGIKQSGFGGGGSPSPLPFFGNQTFNPWVRPGLAQFTTWINQAPGTVGSDTIAAATATDNIGGLPLVVQAKLDAPGGQVLTALTKAAPAGSSWTITVAFAGFSPVGKSAVVGFYPFVLYDSVQDKALALTWYNGAGPLDGFEFTDTVPESGSVVEKGPFGDLGFPFSDYFEWFRVINDGTNLKFYISPDGLIYSEIYTVTIASLSLTINKVGFGFDRFKFANATTSITADLSAILWSWVES
jgi:hypothetical protein